MAVKLIVTLTFLAFLSAVSYARMPVLLPDDQVVPAFEETTPTVLKPAQNIETESKPESEHEVEVRYAVNDEIGEKAEEGSAPTEKKTESIETTVPLTVVTFRPINRHFFPRRPLLPLRPRIRCRNGHKMTRPPRFYGNDMILSDEDLRFDDRVSHGGIRQVPVRWARFRHGGHRFSFDDNVVNREERERGHKKHHKRRHEEDEYPEIEEDKHEHEHKHKWGFMKGIRKFLKNALD